MKRALLFPIFSLLSACASDPEMMSLPPPEGLRQEALPTRRSYQEPQVSSVPRNIIELKNRLGMDRHFTDLGFDERGFDGCQWGFIGDGKCGQRYMSIVHFRLLCRDSVETVQTVSNSFTPLAGERMQWRLAGSNGSTQTDGQGFGQVQAVLPRSANGKRFILIIGTRSLGLEVNEVSQIILPSNWCNHVASREPISIPDLANFEIPYVLSAK